MVTESTMTVEERLTRIEQSIEKLANGIDQAPMMMSIATDSIDELLRNAKDNGTNIDDRLKSGLHLLGRLSDPKVNGALNNLLDAVEQGPGLVSIIADTVDETMKSANTGTVRMDDRIKGITHLLNKLSDPTMVDKVDSLLKLSDQAPGLVAMTMDSVDAFMMRYGEDFKAATAFMGQENLIFLKNAAESFTEAQKQPPAKVGGIFGMLRTLKDPSRQKSLGFLMNVLKNLGNKL
ncbi:MAG: DUF1641 domain-containing protein [Saprospiraceae bacterium]